MAIQWGAASGSFRLGIDLVGATLIVYGQSVAYGHDWSSTLTRSGSWSGSTAVSFSSGFDATVTKEFYRQTVSASGTYSASISYWNGNASVSRTVSLGSKPGVPSGFTITMTGATTATLSFTKGSGAVSTQITASHNGGTWYNLGNPTGTSHPVSGLTLNSWWRFQAYSKNSAGNSAVIGPYTMYTKPATPSVPTLSAGRKVSWTSTASYVAGYHVRRTDNNGATSNDYVSHSTTWTDPNPQTPTTKYAVCVVVGPNYDDSSTLSDFSGWSETAFNLVYKYPQVTRVTAVRCDSAGVVTANGTFLRVVSSGTVTAVSGNLMTRKVWWRKTGTSEWTSATPVNNVVAASWNDAVSVVGGGLVDVLGSYEVSVSIQDSYSGLVEQRVMVPTAEVPFSIGKDGVGAGKIYERGGVDVAGGLYVDGATRTRTQAGTFVKTVPAGASWVEWTFPTFPYKHTIMVWNGDATAQHSLYVIGDGGQMNSTLGGALSFKVSDAAAGPARFTWIAVPAE